MKIFITVVFVILLGSLVRAQNIPKAKAFINEFIVSDYIQDSIVSEAISKGRYKMPKKPQLIYTEITGGSTYMREAMQANKNGVFYNMRNDSVIYIDSAGKKSRVSRIDSYRLHPLPGSARFQQILGDSLKITSAERAYINAQIENMDKHIWQEGLVLGAHLVTSDSVKRVFDKWKVDKISRDSLKKVFEKWKADKMFDAWDYFNKNGVDRIYTFGMPIFFRNDTYCFFYYGYTCGRLCGEGKVSIYKKVKGKWEPFSTLISWVS